MTEPGLQFIWQHNLNEKRLKKLRLIELEFKEKNEFWRNLHKLGYSKIKNLNLKRKKNLIKAFQRRYRQNLINGILDKECLKIIKNLNS